MADWPRIIDEQHKGDPFVKIVECEGKRYAFDEAALIEATEHAYRSLEMDFRLKCADGMRKYGLGW
jgi:hypothetical protein